MNVELSLDEIRALLERLDLPLDAVRDEYEGNPPALQGAFTKLREARRAEIERVEQQCSDVHCELPRGHQGVHQFAIRVRR